jgi:hypothetical protein
MPKRPEFKSFPYGISPIGSTALSTLSPPASGPVLDLMMPGGGYIAGASHDTILEETPVENVLEMFDTIEQYGVY